METSSSGGSALTCVVESPRNPAGPSADRAVTTVLPIARCPSARQNSFASISLPADFGSVIAVLPNTQTSSRARAQIHACSPSPAMRPAGERRRSQPGRSFVEELAWRRHGRLLATLGHKRLIKIFIKLVEPGLHVEWH